jgi:hypothetical protein
VAVLSEETRAALIEALQAWVGGNQQGAVDRLRAEADAEEPASLGLIAWFMHQMGEPHWRNGVPYAEKAIQKGMPWVANYYVGNMLNDPSLRTQVPEFIKPALEAGVQLDPIANALSPFQQGDQATALALIDTATGPWPWPAGWRDLISRGEQRLQELEAASGDVGQRRDAAIQAITADEQRVHEQSTRLDTRTKTLEALLDRIANAEVQTFFEQEATDYQTEGSTLWRWGVGVLVAASGLAILPIAAYYIGQILNQGWFEEENLVAAHFAPAIALGAVAGVLLSRARGRDRARQRARDLSVALGTMFVYTGQIADESERQRFVHEMGRTVIEAFLRQDSSSSEVSDGRSLLSAITQRS